MNVRSPLQPKQYALKYLSLEENPTFRKTSKDVKMLVSFPVRPRLFQRPRSRDFLLRLEIRVNESAKAFKLAPYRATLRLDTYFEVDPGLPPDKMKQMLWYNGLSIAYGIARGIIGQATAQGSHAKFVLPAVNFVEILKHRKVKK
jgi:preprotein translocase subunit SecB